MVVGRIGPYEVLEALGSGGMGIVHRARVRETVAGFEVGSDVALKLVHPHLLQHQGSIQRFLREATIGQTIRHPNVVRCFDSGTFDADGLAHHYLAMELVEGQTLRELLEELDRVPEELCRHIGREVARGLSAIHAGGVVHRDLKPENVLITATHVVKVMDLGVARLQDEAIRLSKTGQFVGSINYAAPEQFGLPGDQLDGRADLHALGVILYELATGVHPFHHEDPRAILRRVIEEEPRRCAELNPQLSPFFEEVVHALLVKDRKGRLASATLLFDILDQGEEGPWWRSRAQSLRRTTRRPLRRVRIPRETALYGRQDDLRLLRTLYDDARNGEGRVLLLEGEAGVGKTRLVDEFVAGLQQEGEDLNFLFGSYLPGGAATAAGAWSTAYREHFGTEGLEATLRDYLTATPVLIPSFAALLRGEPPPRGEEPLRRDSVQTVFVHATRALADERPTVVLIEDLHFAPDEGRNVFTSLALAVPGHRVLLVGTMRPDVSQTWVAHVERQEHARRHVLSRLGARDLVTLLGEAFHSEALAEQLCGRIAVKSDGNPYFVFEIIRGLRDERLIAQRPDGTWITTDRFRDVKVPSSVTDLVNARIGELERDERELLEVAACAGFEFDPTLVALAAEVERVPGLKRFGQIEKRHRLVHSAGRRMVFDHHQVQEALYAGIMEPLREAYHLAIAEVLEAKARADGLEPHGVVGERAVQLVEHFQHAARPARSIPYLERAVAHLTRAHAHERALALEARVLESPGLLQGKGRAGALLDMAHSLAQLGRHDEGRAALDEAVPLARDAGDAELLARALVRLGTFELFAGAYDDAVATSEEALHVAQASGDAAHESSAYRALGSIYQRLGRLDEARDAFERSGAIARSRGDREGEGGSLGGLGIVLYVQGRYEEAAKHFQRSLEYATDVGDRQGQAIATGNLGAALRYLGRYADGLDCLERRLELARELGDRRGEGIVRSNLGGLFVMLGDRRAARRHLEASLRILDELDARRERGFALNGLGAVAEQEEDRGEALRYYEEVLALRREMKDPHGTGGALLQIARITRLQGRTEEARTMLQEAYDLGVAQDAPDLLVGAKVQLACLSGADVAEAESLLARYTTRVGASDRMQLLYDLYVLTSKRLYLEEAHRLLMHLQRHAPEAYRTSLVENVPDHLAIHDAWSRP